MLMGVLNQAEENVCDIDSSDKQILY